MLLCQGVVQSDGVWPGRKTEDKGVGDVDWLDVAVQRCGNDLVELAEGVALARADVEGLVVAAFERAQIGAGYVIDEDVVAQFVGGAADSRAAFLQQHANDVAERMVEVFALRLAVDIGVAKDSVGQAILARVVANVPFGGLLADLLRLTWAKGGVFRQGQAFRAVVEVVAARSKDDFLDRGAHTAIQHVEQAAHLDIGIQQRLLCGQVSLLALGRVMTDNLWTLCLQKRTQLRVAQIKLVETRAPVERLARAIDERINYKYIMPGFEIGVDNMRSDKTCTANDCNFHVDILPLAPEKIMVLWGKGERDVYCVYPCLLIKSV